MTMLAIFDNDGTLCDTQEVEGSCYARAIESVTGKVLSTLDWTTYDDPTSSGIVRDLLAGDPHAGRREVEIKQEFLRLLEEGRPKFPGDFSPVAGAVEFITRLKNDGICSVAIATGCFDTSARFKLQCCGIDLDAFPFATSSDTPKRQDIIGLAARRAGFGLESAVYFGDAPWDVRVSRTLGLPMIGIGRRHERLKALGVAAFPDYSEPNRIIEALLAVRKKANQARPQVAGATIAEH